jgi:nitrate reductase NapAB chaperone NapD
MPVTSAIVEVTEGSCEAVMSSLAKISNLSVFAIKENQIVTVIEGDSLQEVEETMKGLYALDNVIGVFPVYAGDYE